MAVRRNVDQGRCKRCRGRLPQGARRCARCGAQAFVAQQLDPAESARSERKRLFRKYKLTEIQARILAAAFGGKDEIIVCGDRTPAEGEVKAGGERFYGDDAVVAVATLVGPGLVSPNGGDAFRLTADGTKLAEALAAEAQVES
jgi:hypothetical protein